MGRPSPAPADRSSPAIDIVRLDTEVEAGDDKVFGIDVAASDCVIKNNRLAYAASAYGGIEASGSHSTVENNSVLCLAREAGESPSIGILLGRLDAQGTLGSSGGRIANNNVLGAQDGIVVVANSGSDIVENRVDSSAGEARFGILLISVDRSRVRGNRLTNVLSPIAANQGMANEIYRQCAAARRPGGDGVESNVAGGDAKPHRRHARLGLHRHSIGR